MSPKRFKRHLEKLRQLRPAFREFLEEAANHEKTIRTSRPNVRSTNLLEQAQYVTHLHKTFLSRQTRKEMDSPDSHVIEQQLHPNAALSYSHFSDLQHFFLKKPLPGRGVGVVNQNQRSQGLIAAFAGMTTELPVVKSEAIATMDWKTLVERGIDTGGGISYFRMSNAQLHKAPVVVGSRPEGLGGMILKTTVSSHGKVDMTKPNPHLPWTREYVAHFSDAEDSKHPKAHMIKPKRKQVDLNARILGEKGKDTKDMGMELLNNLAELMNK